MILRYLFGITLCKSDLSCSSFSIPYPEEDNLQTITFPREKNFQQKKKMCDPDDDTARNGATPPSSRSREILMDVDDLDLDGSWPLDQIPYLSSSNRMISPIFVSSSSEQPCSPLWAFSDGGVNNHHATADGEKISSASGVPSFRLPDYPLFLPC